MDLFLEKKPKEYFDVLGPYSRLERIPNNNSLYYNNTNQENCFYDKIRCSLDKGIPTPEEWKAKNILRSERTYKSKMIHGLCYDCEYDYLSLERLSERRLCAMLIDEWYEFYTGIVKTNPVYLDFKNAESPKDILNNFIAVTVDFYGGYESVIKMIDIGSRLSPFKHTKYSTRLKTMVKAIITNKRFLKESEYLTELDNAFKRKGVEFYDELHLYMLTRLQSTLKNSENFDRIDSFTVLDSVILWMKGEKKFEELIPYFFE